MIQAADPVMTANHLRRYDDMRTLELKAGRTLLGICADIGDVLIDEQEKVEAAGQITWKEWLAHQAQHDRQKGYFPLDERRAREYMAAARFRIDMGEEQFLSFVRVQLCCLMPLLPLTKDQRMEMARNGVKTESGAVAPLEEAKRADVRAAVREIQNKPPAAPPTREQKIAAIKKQIAALGDLSDAEQAELADAIGVEAEPEALAAEPASGAVAPLQTYRGMLGPVTLTGGRLVLGTRERTALASDGIAAIDQARDKCMLVNGGTGTLAAGVKTKARAAVEALRLAVLKWPAFT